MLLYFNPWQQFKIKNFYIFDSRFTVDKGVSYHTNFDEY